MTDLTLYQALELVNTTEEMALLWNRLQVHKKDLKRQIKEAEEQVQGAILDKMEEMGITSFEEGGVRYYAGDVKKMSIVDKETLLEALITAVGGDLRRLSEAMVSAYAKVGESREILGEDFDEHFKTETVPKLKEGKPKKRLIAAKAEYVK